MNNRKITAFFTQQSYVHNTFIQSVYICAALQSLAYTKKTFLDVVVGIFCLVGSAFSYFSSLQCCCITEFLSLSKACNDTIVTIGDIFIELSSRFLLFVFFMMEDMPFNFLFWKVWDVCDKKMMSNFFFLLATRASLKV